MRLRRQRQWKCQTLKRVIERAFLPMLTRYDLEMNSKARPKNSTASNGPQSVALPARFSLYDDLDSLSGS